MIKKHLIACSGLLVIMLLAKLFLYTSPVQSLKSFSQKVNLPFQEEEIASTKKVQVHRLTFSNENLPKGKYISLKMKKYLRSHSYKHIQTNKLHHKAARWFPVIVPILKAYGIPEDFKYMPLVESGGLAEGTSPRGAAGFWQFMPGTARSYGLRVNSDVDERKNMRKSTIAACKYLKELHGIFHSWTLAAAAYNIGEVNLLRQMARQGHRNYYKLKLNGETASYVYKIIAMKEIIENPAKHGFVKRSRQLLAHKEETKPVNYFMNPPVEQDALKALSVLRN
ncbi:MAG: lytic transglycosylase domain-containing protein [Pyrinomonadaceae bacterium]|nr:lytic transglycosylase domain-containing protein [Sphingobacteriaceae bacterium]